MGDDERAGHRGTVDPLWPDLASIRSYYDATTADYRFLWLNPDNRAMHFGYWDELTRSHGESLINLNRVLAREIGIRPGQRVLDAGCGVGGSAIWLAKTYGVEVVGITPVAGQVRQARRYAKQHRMAGVSFDEQDFTRTRFRDASFDVVWAQESACHAPDKRLFFQEMRRVLRPGGRLGMTEYVRTARPYPPEVEKLLHRWLDGWAIPDLGTRDELREFARGAGFVDVRLLDITANVRPSFRRLFRMCTILGPLETTLRTLRLRSEDQHGNAVGGREQYRALERGLWFYSLLTATADQA